MIDDRMDGIDLLLAAERLDVALDDLLDGEFFVACARETETHQQCQQSWDE